MQRHATWLERARALEVAGLDLERIEVAVAVSVDPAADRIAVEGGLDPLGPTPSIGEDASMRFMDVINQDPGRLGFDDDLHWPEVRHHRRHAGRQAARTGPEARTALRLISEALFELCLVFGREWRLLRVPP